MRVENLTLTNFNNREYQVHTYALEPNPELVEQKRPLAIVVPGGSFNHLSGSAASLLGNCTDHHSLHDCASSFYDLTDRDRRNEHHCLSWQRSAFYKGSADHLPVG